MRPLLAAALIALAGPAALVAQEPSPPPAAAERLPSVQLPTALERVLRDYERALPIRDAASVAALFTEDGMMLASWRVSARS